MLCAASDRKQLVAGTTMKAVIELISAREAASLCWCKPVETETETQVNHYGATGCLTQMSHLRLLFPPHPDPKHNFPPFLIPGSWTSAQFHFAMWQLCYLCHLGLSGRSISAAANSHVCISLGPFVRRKRQDGGGGGNLSAQISFHLWYRSTSFTRAKWDFRKEIFLGERALKLNHGNTKGRSWLRNSLRHTQKKVRIWA